MSQVVLQRDLHTEVGIFAAGSVFNAKRVKDGWRVRLLPTQFGGPDHTAVLALTDVRFVHRGAA